jgi:tetratricopeptide (TPR) repeat protein
MNTTAYSADVYISYAGNDEGDAYENSRDEIVKKICEQLQQNNLRPIEYKTDVDYKTDLRGFMLDIAYGDFVIPLVSKKYLTSEYCMFEAISFLNRNPKDFEEKVFPIVLQDANIFSDDVHIEYVSYWDDTYNNLSNKLKGKDPTKLMSLYEKAKTFREISNNIDEFLARIAGLAQLSNKTIKENNYQAVIDAIVKEIARKYQLQIPIQATTTTADNSNALFPQILNNADNTQNIASLAKASNDYISQLTDKVDAVILDSENAKKEYIDINFDEISSDKELSPGMSSFIFGLRADKTKYEPYRQALIISALSLGLIKKYDETKALLLIDFAKDDDPVLSYRALAGLVTALIDKEDFISADIEQKLEPLRDNTKIQVCLLNIFYFIGNITELHSVARSLQNIDYSKFEFFDKTQHWFLTFYENNPVLKDNVPDKKFAAALFDAAIYLGLDSTKYALALLYPTLERNNIDEFKKFCELDKTTIDSINNNTLKSKFLLGVEVSKYLLEFYIYALNKKYDHIVNIIEDTGNLRNGYLYKLLVNDMYQALLKANMLYVTKQYEEAKEAVKPLLEDQPNNIDALIIYGSASYFLQQYEDVITAFEKLTSKGVTEIQTLAFLGDAYFNKPDYKKAIATYEQLILVQTNIPAYINIGRGYQLIEEPDNAKALTYFLKVYELEPANYYNLLLTGDCYLKQTPEDFEKAFEYYQKAFDIDASNINLVKAMTDCISNLPNLPVDECEKVFLKWIELEPKNAYPYLALGDRYRQQTPPDHNKAFEYYYEGLPLSENNLALFNAMDDCIYNMDAVDAGKVHVVYEKFLALDAKNTAANNGMAYSYALKDPPDYENAFDYYYRSFLLNPTVELIEFLFAYGAKLKDPDDTKINELYTTYKTLAPNSAKPYVTTGIYYSEKMQPDFNKAEAIYMEALKLYPTDKDVLSALGKFYQIIPQPDLKRSFQYLGEALKQDPDNFSAKFYSGWGNFISGNFTDAKKYFEDSLSNKRDEDIIYQNLGHIAFIENNISDAKDLYSKGFALFKDKKYFYESSLSDWQYIEKDNADKAAFENLLNEVIGAKNDG